MLPFIIREREGGGISTSLTILFKGHFFLGVFSPPHGHGGRGSLSAIQTYRSLVCQGGPDLPYHLAYGMDIWLRAEVVQPPNQNRRTHVITNIPRSFTKMEAFDSQSNHIVSFQGLVSPR